MEFFQHIQFVDVIEFFGTFAFAISGIRMASAKRFDLFGAFVVGFVTAIGGGTVRDLLLGVTPFWMQNPVYMWCTLAALVFVMIFRKHLVHLDNTFFVFDSIGLGLFVVVGVEKTIDLGYPAWVAITMGTITGAIGGVIRDMLIN
ncbi:MAG: TRIC cation channel family protein, partial [Candidatus Accumulibacter sp.]|nr:TRIC cation channel family protein [Accumulibacter sp.]